MLSDSNQLLCFKPVVFYDGSCPMCQREIHHYQRLDRNNNINWIDITTDKAGLLAFGLDKDEAMQRFHVMDKNGSWHIGAYGFAELWSHLPGYRWLSRFVKRFYLLPLLDRAYTIITRYRIMRNCKNGSCKSI